MIIFKVFVSVHVYEDFKGGQKVQTSNYKIITRNVIYNMTTMANTAV